MDKTILVLLLVLCASLVTARRRFRLGRNKDDKDGKDSIDDDDFLPDDDVLPDDDILPDGDDPFPLPPEIEIEEPRYPPPRRRKKFMEIFNRETDHMDRIVKELQDQLEELKNDYEMDIDEARSKFMKIDDELKGEYRKLYEDFTILDLEYAALESRYQDYDDRCEYNEYAAYQQVLFKQNQKASMLAEQQRFYRDLLYGRQNTYEDLPPLQLPEQNRYKPDRINFFGWEMVLRAQRGNGDSVYDAWQSAGSYKRFSRDCDKPYCYNCGHWRSYLVDNWDDLWVHQVKVELYKDDMRVAWMIFDGEDSTKFNWFDQSRLIESSWSDLTNTTDVDHFYFRGGDHREFLISKEFGMMCSTHFGWLQVLDADPEPDCLYNHVNYYPAFLYTKYHGSNWSLMSTMDEADILAIYINYEKHDEELEW